MKLAKFWIGALALLFSASSFAAVTYTYDNLNRLTNVDYGNGTSQAYTYDAAGNLLSLVTTGATCSYSITPGNQAANAIGMSGTVSVSAPSGCAWTATSNASWLTVTSGSGGTASYTVTANTDANPRTGTLTIAGQTFTVTQNGASVALTGKRNEYQITQSGGSYAVADLVTGRDGTLDVASVDHLVFSDMTVNLTVQAKADTIPPADLQQLQELYVAFFNRVPNADGLAYWIDQFNAGMSISQIAESFYAAGVQNSSTTGYSPTMSDSDFIHVIYRNVLGRPEGAAADGLAYWSGELASGRATRGTLVTSILNSAHILQSDPTYGWVADLLDNKITVAHQFSVTLGLSYKTADDSITNGMAIASAVTPTSTAAATALIGVGQ